MDMDQPESETEMESPKPEDEVQREREAREARRMRHGAKHFQNVQNCKARQMERLQIRILGSGKPSPSLHGNSG
jgi:hypothetical protein